MTDTWWTIRTWNGDNLANIKATSEEQALVIYWAMEEHRALKGRHQDMPDGRELITRNRTVN